MARSAQGLFSGTRGAVLAIVVLALAALAAAWLDVPPPPVSGRAQVSDGDSFRLGEDRIRLLGLDAPELSQTCTDAVGASWPCGGVARDRMSDLLKSGTITCKPEENDRYGRLLARCEIRSKDLGATMVAEGLAIASGDYGAEEAAARAARLGIWAGGFTLPRDWRDDHPRPAGLLSWLWL